MKSVLECVPNFSEGRDAAKIEAIANEIRQTTGVKLLHIDIGYDANRTVMTFAGEPNQVVEAAFKAVKKATKIIDMRQHQGVHPRFGATDVLPLIPVKGLSMDETVDFARTLGKRIGQELGVHVYCYEYAAFTIKRQNLAYCRAGEYEGLKTKIATPEGKPDYGPDTFNEQSGAVAVGARNFLIAFNVNLNTTNTDIAKKIAADIRESGHWTEGSDVNGTLTRTHIPGTLKAVKAIGWYIPAYEKAQVSTNLTNIDITPVHVVFNEIKSTANRYRVDVTGSELIGLIPLKVMLQAGEYYLGTSSASDLEKVKSAIHNLRLDELGAFVAEERILEWALGAKGV